VIPFARTVDIEVYIQRTTHMFLRSGVKVNCERVLIPDSFLREKSVADMRQ